LRKQVNRQWHNFKDFIYNFLLLYLKITWHLRKSVENKLETSRMTDEAGQIKLYYKVWLHLFWYNQILIKKIIINLFVFKITCKTDLKFII
jgi:hypothetical protein